MDRASEGIHSTAESVKESLGFKGHGQTGSFNQNK